MPFYQIRALSTSNTTAGIASLNSTEISASNTAVDFLSSNAKRKSLSIINESNSEMLIQTGTAAASAASPTSKMKIVPPQTEYSWDAHVPLTALNGIWVGDSPTGKAVIVEGV